VQDPDPPGDEGHAAADAATRRDPKVLARLFLYGSATTRQRLAEQLLADGNRETWRLLAATVRFDEPWRLRSRCLEALGLIAGSADEPTAKEVLNILLGPLPQPPPLQLWGVL
jgi:hypothetical protein